MTDAPDTHTTAQSMLGADYKAAAPQDGDPNAYRTTADPRYMAALAEQKAKRVTLTPRRRPVLRLVWDRDATA